MPSSKRPITASSASFSPRESPSSLGKHAASSFCPAERSCLECHRRKIKCDRQLPCSYCTKTRVHCVSAQPSRKSRRFPGPTDVDVLTRLRCLEDASAQVDAGTRDGDLDRSSFQGRMPPTADQGHRNTRSEISPVGEDVTRDHGDEDGKLVFEKGKPRYVHNSFWAELDHEVCSLSTQSCVLPRITEMERDKSTRPLQLLFSGFFQQDASVSSSTFLIHSYFRRWISAPESMRLSVIIHCCNNHDLPSATVTDSLVSQKANLEDAGNGHSDNGEHGDGTAQVSISSFQSPTTHSGFIFSYHSLSQELQRFHPPPERIFSLWQLYLESVDPLLKMFHSPTIQKQVLRAGQDLSNIGRGTEALMFAIYYAAVTSMEKSECLRCLKEERTVLLER